MPRILRVFTPCIERPMPSSDLMPPAVLTRKDIRPLIALAVYGPLYTSEIANVLDKDKSARDYRVQGGLVVRTG